MNYAKKRMCHSLSSLGPRMRYGEQPPPRILRPINRTVNMDMKTTEVWCLVTQQSCGSDRRTKGQMQVHCFWDVNVRDWLLALSGY